MPVCFEWDANKNRSNKAKHGISFDTAVAAFTDPSAIIRPDLEFDGEQRWHTIGRIGAGILVILVVHTLIGQDDDQLIRIVSARKATPRERRFYEESDGRQ